MKVVLVNDRLNAGGAEKMLVYIANMLYKNNIEVSVVLLLSKAALDNQIHPNIPINYINRTSRFSIKAFVKIKKFVKEADIVHVHSRYNLRYYMIAKFLMNIKKPRIFFHEHVPSFEIDFFTKTLFALVDGYVAVQDKMRQWAVEKKMVTSNKAFYLANTVDAPIKPIIYNNNSFKIIMIGNYRPQKNQLFAVSLLAKLPNNYSLDIYGMIDDENYFRELKTHIEKLGQQHRVNLVQGITNIYDQLSQYKFALHTASIETGPLVLVEYLYAKLPFITYKTGDVVTLLQDYLPNFIIDSFNEDEWLNSINNFNKKGSWVHEKIQMENIIEQHFSGKTYLTKLLSIYNKIIA